MGGEADESERQAEAELQAALTRARLARVKREPGRVCTVSMLCRCFVCSTCCCSQYGTPIMSRLYLSYFVSQTDVLGGRGTAGHRGT